MSSSSFDEGIETEIPALFFMFSASDDSQQACDIDNVASFTLPDPAGKSGGACTSALLQVLYNDEEDVQVDLSWVETLNEMHQKLIDIGLPQVPQLSSSRMIDLEETLQIVPDGYEGTKRAMLIGINYTGEPGALTSCHNDVRNIKDFLIKVHDFQREDMLILMDDGKHHEPTKKMIMDGFKRLVDISEPGDVVFIQFSGHGGQIVDTSGDEDDGFDEILIPGDYKETGQIVDDEIYEEFVTKMGPGVAVTALIDCCHSGTAMDLPYICSAGDTEIHRDNGFKIPQSGMDLPPPKKKKDKEKKEKGDDDKKPRKKKGKEEKVSSPKKKKKEQLAIKPEKEELLAIKPEKKKKKKKESVPEPEEEEEEDAVMVEEVYSEEELEQPEPSKPAAKKKGMFGFGKKKK